MQNQWVLELSFGLVMGSVGDPIERNYVASGHSREAVPYELQRMETILPMFGNLSMGSTLYMRWGLPQIVLPKPFSCMIIEGEGTVVSNQQFVMTCCLAEFVFCFSCLH